MRGQHMMRSSRATREFHSSGKVSMIFPCLTCGAKDCRDSKHKQGCPSLPPVSATRMHELSAAVIEGWRSRICEGAE